MRRALKLTALALVVVMTVSLSACSSESKPFETPSGPQPGEQFGGFEILGVVHKATTTLNQANAHNSFKEKVTINVPVGTELIVPSIRGWRLAYGSGEPNTVESHIAAEGSPSLTWHYEDHHLGVASANIFVEDINATSANGTQTATLEVSMMLTDDNADDKWFGLINYTLICLGPKAPPRPIP